VSDLQCLVYICMALACLYLVSYGLTLLMGGVG
jgi:hypothetical protein